MTASELRIRDYGSAILHSYLVTLTADIAGVRTSKDSECLHRMRVASRRLRAALPLFAFSIAPRQAEEWTRQVRKITRALGPAREADVQLDQLNAYLQTVIIPQHQPGVRRLQLRIAQQRASFQPGLVKTLETLERSDWIRKLEEKIRPEDEWVAPSAVSPQLYHLAMIAIRRNLQSMLSYSTEVFYPERIEQLHQMRIAAKKLRYTVEIFAPLYGDELKPHLRTIKYTQELLGTIHDADIWLLNLPRLLEEERLRTISYFGHLRSYQRFVPGYLGWQAVCQAQRKTGYACFIDNWENSLKTQVWDQLNEAIEIRPGLPVPMV